MLIKYLFVLLFIPLIIIAQDNIIKGIITKGADSSRAQNAIIKIIELNLHTLTDSNGSFQFNNIKDGNYTFEIIADRFIPFISTPLFVANNSTYNLIFNISELPFNLNSFLSSTSDKSDFIYNSPQNIDIIKKGDFFANSTLAELLNNQSGYQIFSGFSPFGNIFFHGSANNTGICLDGINLINSNFYFLSNLFPIDFIERIEINKQPSSCLNGTQFSMSSVYLFSRTNISKEEVTFKGVFNNIKGNSLTGKFLKQILFPNSLLDSISIFVQANFKYQQSQNSNIALYNYPHINSKNIYANIRGWFSEQLMANFSIFYSNNTLKYPSQYELYNSNYNNFNNDNYFSLLFTTISFEYKLNTNNSLTAISLLNNNLDENSFIYSPFEKIISNRISNKIYFSSRVNKIFYYDVGFENNYEFGLFTTNKDFKYVNRNNAFYILSNFTFKKIIANINLRSTYYADNKFIFTPEINSLLKINNSTSVKIGYSAGYNLPDGIYLFPNFKYYNSDVFYKGNNNLKPEITSCFYIGLNYTDFDNYYISLNIFNNKISNLIKSTYKNSSNGTSEISYINKGEINNSGAELNIDFSFVRNLLIKFTYCHIITKDNNNNELLFRSPNSANLAINYLLPSIKMSVWAVAKWIDKKDVSSEQQLNNINFFYSDIPSFSINSYGLLNIFIAKQLSQNISSELGINNLLNYQTQRFGNFTEREFYLAIKFNWQKDIN
ncbi:MAG: TonB-dependent receptor [bacterium]